MRKIYHTFICTIIAFAASILLPETLSAQECSISGTLCDTTGRAITDVTAVVVMSRADSTTLKQEYVSTGSFRILYPPPAGDAMVYISSYGFESRYLPLNGAHNDLGKIVLRPLQIDIESVVVKANAPLGYEFVRGKDQFKIPESFGENQYDLKSLLGEIPGLVYDGEKVSIIGRGSPTYLINGFKPRTGELDALRPEDIERVDIDRMPSARFDKTVQGVINIVTRNRKYDYFNAYLENEFNYQQYASNKTKIAFNNRLGKWSNYVGYNYGYNHMKARLLYETTLHGDNGDMVRLSDQIMKNIGHSYNFDISPKYEINKKSYVDLQYSLGRSRVKVPDTRMYDVKELEYSDITSDSDIKNINHNVLLRYGNNFKEGHRLSVSIGYGRIGKDSDDTTDERIERYSDGATQNIYTHYITDFNSDVLSAVADYQFPLSKNISGETGGEFSRIWNNSMTQYDGSDRIETITTETQASAYFNLGQTINKFYYQVGIRGEYLHKIGTDGERIDEVPFSFLPTVSLSYSLSKQSNISLYFRRYNIHPTVSQRDPTLRYSNRYQWAQGNPNLKSTLVNELSLSFGLPKGVNLTATYKYAKNAIIQAEDLYDEEKRSTLFTRYNFPVYNDLSVIASWNGTINAYYRIQLSGSYSQTWAESPFLGGVVRYDQPMFDGYMAHHFRFDRDGRYVLGIRGAYSTAYDYLNCNVAASWRLGAYLRMSLLKNRNLRIMIEGNNLLHSDYEQTSKYKQISSRNINYMYNRSISFGIIYRFNNYQSVFKQNNSNAGALGRAQ